MFNLSTNALKAYKNNLTMLKTNNVCVDYKLENRNLGDNKIIFKT